MKKTLTIAALTAATIVGATEIWARGQITCEVPSNTVQLLLMEIEDRPYMSIDEAFDWRYQYNTGDVGKPPLYSDLEVSDGSWKEIVLEIWEEREPHRLCQRDVLCRMDHRNKLGSRVEANCERGEYRPNVWHFVQWEVKEAYARLMGDKS